MTRAKIGHIGKMALMLVLFFAVSGQAVDQGRPDSASLGNYITHFFMRANAYSKQQWRLDPDSSNIRRSIDAALLDISANPALPDACQRKAVIVTGSDSASFWYALPRDCIEALYVNGPKPTGRGLYSLTRIDQGEIGSMTSESGKPIYFCTFGDSICFDPNNQADDTLFISYRAYSNKLEADSVVSNVKLVYFNLAVELAIINFYQGRRGADVAGIIAQAKEQIALIATHLGIRPESVLPQVK